MENTLPKLILAFFLSVSLVGSAIAGNKKVISFAQLEEMFGHIKSQGKLNLDEELLWGYFFTDKDPQKLEPVKKALIENGYRFVNLYPTRDKSTFFLHVERIEQHTSQSLYQRNLLLYKLADKYNIESYDGMDVGPVK